MDIDIRLRPAREEERSALGALKLRASLGWGDHMAELLALPEARELAPELLPTTVVAEVSGVPAGFATIVMDDQGDAELEELFVDPAWWRRGIGRCLVEQAVQHALTAGSNAIHVIASRKARAFYEASGFELVGEVMTQFEPAISMRRRIE
jgi:GNAT superfamily N-acetyltransferase